MRRKEDIVGYPVDVASLDECLVQIEEWLSDEDECRYLVCANPHSLVTAQSDSKFCEAIHAADMVTPDGAGIVLASKVLGGGIPARITGSDIFYGLSNRLNSSGGRSYFFLGSTGEALDRIAEKLAVDFPAIRLAGSWSPPFKEEFSARDNRSMVEAINRVKPDVLWVGMTAPKQEKWIYENRDQLDVRFIGAIGAVFDFYTGNVKRSPVVFQKLGLEWLPRLVRQPRKLWRRNFVSTPLFLWMLVKQRFFS